MAALPPGKDGPPGGQVHNSVEDQQHLDHLETTVEVDENQYQDGQPTHDGPINARDEEVVGETQFNQERLESDGTVNSVSLDTEAATVLAELTAQPRRDDAEVTTDDVSAQGTFLSRPEGLGELDADTGFTFANAGRQQVASTGARKGPFAAMTAAIDQIGETANEEVNYDTQTLGKLICHACVKPIVNT